MRSRVKPGNFYTLFPNNSLMNLRIVIWSVLTAGILLSCNHSQEPKKMKPLQEDLKPLMQEPKSYVCYRTADALNIAGMPDEQS